MSPELSITKSPYCGGPASIGPADKVKETGDEFRGGTVGSADADRCLSCTGGSAATTAETRRCLRLSVILGDDGGEFCVHDLHLEIRAVISHLSSQKMGNKNDPFLL